MKAKLTFPHVTRPIKLTQPRYLYVVFAQFNDGTWAPAYFFGSAFCSGSYYNASKMIDAIIKETHRQGNTLWTRDRFLVGRVDFEK